MTFGSNFSTTAGVFAFIGYMAAVMAAPIVSAVTQLAHWSHVLV